jgi:glycerophosphoryl diester phosphodiesterase
LSPFGLLDGFRFVKPNPRRVGFLARTPYAHRGLHGTRLVENSRAAVEAAVEAGYGVEVDAHLSLDGAAFVIHDPTLERLTESQGEIRRFASRDLSAVKLKRCDETLPRLEEILAIVNGRVPILIELKPVKNHVLQLCVAVRHALASYRGQAAVMSFNGDVSRWFEHYGEHIPRGLIMSGQKDVDDLRTNAWRARAEFLAIDIRDLPRGIAARQRRRGVPVLSWTVRNPEQQAIAEKHADQVIFEAPGW